MHSADSHMTLSLPRLIKALVHLANSIMYKKQITVVILLRQLGFVTHSGVIVKLPSNKA